MADRIVVMSEGRIVFEADNLDGNADRVVTGEYMAGRRHAETP